MLFRSHTHTHTHTHTRARARTRACAHGRAYCALGFCTTGEAPHRVNVHLINQTAKVQLSAPPDLDAAKSLIALELRSTAALDHRRAQSHLFRSFNRCHSNSVAVCVVQECDRRAHGMVIATSEVTTVATVWFHHNEAFCKSARRLCAVLGPSARWAE